MKRKNKFQGKIQANRYERTNSGNKNQIKINNLDNRANNQQKLSNQSKTHC